MKRILILLLAAGCAHLRAPESGGPEWTRFETPGLVVETDVPREQAAPMVADLERLRVGMLRIMWGVEKSHADKIRLVKFRSIRELWEFSKPDAYGGWGGAVIRDPVVLVMDDEAGRMKQLLPADEGLAGNERARRLIAATAAQPFVRELPAWLAFGAKDFLADAHVEGSEVVVDGAEYPAVRVRELRTQHPRELAAFVQRFLRGENPRVVAAETIGWRSDEELSVYERAGGATKANLRERVDAVEVDARAMTPAETHALWALAFLRHGVVKRAKVELAAAQQLGPADATVALVSAWFQQPEGAMIDAMRAVRERFPDDPRPCLILLRAAGGEPEELLGCADAFQKAGGDAARADAIRATILEGTRDHDGALAAARRALAAGLNRSDLKLLVAQIELRQGHCEEGLATLSGAVASMSQSEAFGSVLHDLDDLERRCGGRVALALPQPAVATPPRADCPKAPTLEQSAGTVRLEAAIDEKGRVGDIVAGRASPPLIAAAHRWLLSCHIEPGRDAGGAAVPAAIRLEVAFP